jgi:hypothetical protein
MPGLILPMTIHLVDPTREIHVDVDQRDIAAFELEPFGCEFSASRARIFTFMRWTAWHAATRLKLLDMTWEDFGQYCIEVSDFAPDAQVAVDPTAADPSAAT